MESRKLILGWSLTWLSGSWISQSQGRMHCSLLEPTGLLSWSQVPPCNHFPQICELRWNPGTRDSLGKEGHSLQGQDAAWWGSARGRIFCPGPRPVCMWELQAFSGPSCPPNLHKINLSDQDKFSPRSLVWQSSRRQDSSRMHLTDLFWAFRMNLGTAVTPE